MYSRGESCVTGLTAGQLGPPGCSPSRQFCAAEKQGSVYDIMWNIAKASYATKKARRATLGADPDSESEGELWEHRKRAVYVTLRPQATGAAPDSPHLSSLDRGPKDRADLWLASKSGSGARLFGGRVITATFQALHVPPPTCSAPSIVVKFCASRVGKALLIQGKQLTERVTGTLRRLQPWSLCKPVSVLMA